MSNQLQNFISPLTHQLSGLNVVDSLRLLSESFPDQVTFSSSFSFEDQVHHSCYSQQSIIYKNIYA